MRSLPALSIFSSFKQTKSGSLSLQLYKTAFLSLLATRVIQELHACPMLMQRFQQGITEHLLQLILLGTEDESGDYLELVDNMSESGHQAALFGNAAQCVAAGFGILESFVHKRSSCPKGRITPLSVQKPAHTACHNPTLTPGERYRRSSYGNGPLTQKVIAIQNFIKSNGASQRKSRHTLCCSMGHRSAILAISITRASSRFYICRFETEQVVFSHLKDCQSIGASDPLMLGTKAQSLLLRRKGSMHRLLSRESQFNLEQLKFARNSHRHASQ